MSTQLVRTPEDFVKLLMPFASNVAGQMIKKYPLEYEDAQQAAFEGLVEASQRFDFNNHDPTQGSIEQHCKTFAYFRIHGAIVDEVRRNSFVSRSAYAKGKRVAFVSMDEEHDDGTTFEAVAPAAVTDDVLAIRDALDILDPREYRIVMGQAVGMTGKELSVEFGVDESRVSQISIAAREKLKSAMT